MLSEIVFKRGTPAQPAPVDVIGKVAVIGSAEKGTVSTVKGVTPQTDIRSEFGYGHLPETLIDAIGQNASYLYAMKLPDQAGSLTSVTHSGTGTNIPTVSGAPKGGTWPVKVKITLAGAVGVAKAAYSLNGGISYKTEGVIPASGLLVLDDTGITVTYATGGGDLVLGDVDSFWAIAPKGLVSDILSAMDLIQDTVGPEVIVIADPVTPTEAQSILARAEQYFSDIQPVDIVINPRERDVDNDETIEEYQTAILTEYADRAGDFAPAVAGEYAIADDVGEVRFRSLIGVITGQIQFMEPEHSIAWTAFGSLHLVDTWTDWEWEDYLQLDAARFIHARKYKQVAGCYLQDDQLLTDVNSKFRNLRESRVGNEFVRRLYAAAFPLLKGPRPQPGSSLGFGSLKTRLTKVVDLLVKEGRMEKGSIVVVDGGNNTSKVQAGFSPRGTEDQIEITIFVE